MRKDGTLAPMAKNPDADIDMEYNHCKTPMKVILSRATAESFKAQLKYPAGRIMQNNINDSMNLRDFVEYGAKLNSNQKNYGDTNRKTVDVRKWK